MKKIVSIFLAIIMMATLPSAAFASEFSGEIESTLPKATLYNLALNSDGIVSVSDENGDIMPLSSISGYQNGNVSKGSSGFTVWVNASGIGGMGVTVKTSCPNWPDGEIRFTLIGENGSVPINNSLIYANGEANYSNLWHGLPVPSYYLAGFSGIPEGYTVYAQVWIFG